MPQMVTTPTADNPIVPVPGHHAYRLRGGTWIDFGTKGCTVADILTVAARELGDSTLDVSDYRYDLVKTLKIAAAKLRSKE